MRFPMPLTNLLFLNLGGFLYLAVVLDVFSRRVVGWAMETHLRTELVLKALGQRRPYGMIYHCYEVPPSYGTVER
jgi:transposase InsO family protein